MATKTWYIAPTALSLRWSHTQPRRTEEKAHYAAENQVCAKLLEDMGITRPEQNYARWLRAEHADVVVDAQMYIGETISVEVPEDMTPKEFRRWFCADFCASSRENNSPTSSARTSPSFSWY
jgi:hypothetical protein